MRIGLVGCVKGKAGTARPAQDLYISPLFAGRRAFVERSCDRWFILSARHGLIEPSRIIEPYDEALQGLAAAERREWSRQVIRQLGVVIGPLRDQSFEIHAGAAYAANDLVAALTEMGAVVDMPARGLSIGKLLAFYGRPDGGSQVTIASPGPGGRRGIMPHEPLREYLSSSPSPVTLGFSDIEAIIGRPLPASARKHRAWWANSHDRTLAREWLAAGWRADSVDLSAQRVTLIR